MPLVSFIVETLLHEYIFKYLEVSFSFINVSTCLLIQICLLFSSIYEVVLKKNAFAIYEIYTFIGAYDHH